MGSQDMCFTLPYLEPIGSELALKEADGDGYTTESFPPLPHPSPTDYSNFFISDKDKDKSTTRRHKPGHIPRPRNAFILFRSDFVQQRVPEDLISDHRDLSRLAGCMWRKMSDAQKRPWYEKAELEKRYHSEVFPQYRFNPTSPDRPKRVYRKKKLSVAEEILLMYPQRRASQQLASPLPCAASRPSFIPSLSSPVSTQPLSFTPYLAINPNDTLHRSFPRNDEPFHKISLEPSSFDGATGFESSQYDAPSSFCGGFVNVPRTSPRSVEWEFSPPASCIHGDHGDWQSVTDIVPPYVLDLGYPEPTQIQAPVPVPATASASARSLEDEQDSLYSMWRDLGSFHEQGLQAAQNQESAYEHRYPYEISGDSLGNPTHHISYMRSQLPLTSSSPDKSHASLNRSS
ncbi:hypothetical protein NP233_g7335 [Leucocoprinus birnbaumii]|uniref:HMG box domain-containing protein n=1 Tax=Leucocoprinus birnbaumii TaxID=56174 RepID=A0AAD5YP56_9AGAR|nr:hypothetical protein NP233_g7335 [Leucocoprinus birnbaumii]